jgi:hypothetical protein
MKQFALSAFAITTIIGLPTSFASDKSVVPRLCKKLVLRVSGKGHLDLDFHNPNDRRMKERAIDEDAASHYSRLKAEYELLTPPVFLPRNLDHFGSLLAYWVKMINPYDIDAAVTIIHRNITRHPVEVTKATIYGWIVGKSNPSKASQGYVLSAFEDHVRFLRSVARTELEYHPEVILAFEQATGAKVASISDLVSMLEAHLGAKRVAKILEVPLINYQIYSHRIREHNLSEGLKVQEFLLNFQIEHLTNLHGFILSPEGQRELVVIPKHKEPEFTKDVEPNATPIGPKSIGRIREDKFFDLILNFKIDDSMLYDGDGLVAALLARVKRSPPADKKIGQISEDQILDIAIETQISAKFFSGDAIVDRLLEL